MSGEPYSYYRLDRDAWYKSLNYEQPLSGDTYNCNTYLLKESLVSNLKMTWLTHLNQIKQPGLLCLTRRATSFFADDPTVDIFTVLVDNVDDLVLPDVDYQLQLFITGFPLPPSRYIGWQTPLRPTVHVRGQTENGNQRHVYEYLHATNELPLYMGLTVHDGRGTWSGYPAHQFEVDALCAPMILMPDFQEQFAYITDPPYMWGLQTQATLTGERQIVPFKDRDILNVPLSAHHSVSGPGTRLSYIWKYFGAGPKEY